MTFAEFPRLPEETARDHAQRFIAHMAKNRRRRLWRDVVFFIAAVVIEIIFWRYNSR